MAFVITYRYRITSRQDIHDTQTIIIDDLPLWLRDNPEKYLTMCTPINERYDKQTQLELNSMLRNIPRYEVGDGPEII